MTYLDGFVIPVRTADKEIYRVEAAGGTVYRAVCGTYDSASPVVTASASGRAQLTVLQ